MVGNRRQRRNNLRQNATVLPRTIQLPIPRRLHSLRRLAQEMLLNLILYLILTSVYSPRKQALEYFTLVFEYNWHIVLTIKV